MSAWSSQIGLELSDARLLSQSLVTFSRKESYRLGSSLSKEVGRGKDCMTLFGQTNRCAKDAAGKNGATSTDYVNAHRGVN